MTNVVDLKTGYESVIETVTALIDDGVTSQSTISKESGISKTAISQFLKGAYPGNNEKLAGELNNWLAMRQQKTTALPTVPGFIETSTVKQIWNALQYAQIANSISIVYGNPGVSKTKAIREYQHRNNNVWIVTISPSRNSVLECLFEIALELGIHNAPRRKGPLSRLISHKLEGTNGLIIIDEADQLNLEAIEELRSIQERSEVGLSLVGNHQVYSNLTGGRRDLDFARLFSRVGKKLVINKVKKHDVRDVADAWGLVNKAERELVEKIASKPGGLRTLFQTLKLAAVIARGRGKAITADAIKAAFNDLEDLETVGA